MPNKQKLRNRIKCIMQSGSLVTKSCPTLGPPKTWPPWTYPPSFYVLGISQTIILEWVDISSFRDLSEKPTSSTLQADSFPSEPKYAIYNYRVNNLWKYK